MPGRRLLTTALPIGALLLLGLVLHAPPAYPAPGDPPPGSSAGAVYEIPLEQGRSDAAPKGRNGGGAAGEPSSLYRSENNFGSSSRVPGAPAPGRRAAGAGIGSSGGAYGGDGGNGTAGGGGTGAAVRGGDTARAGMLASVGNTSTSGGIGLLVAIAAAATGIGLLSRRLLRRQDR